MKNGDGGKGYGAIEVKNNATDEEEQALISTAGSATQDNEASTSKHSGTSQDAGSGTSPALIVIYGLINTIMCVPCLYGYASVIFNNEAFQPHISSLSKLVLFSSIVHQICFTIFSSLPFSIGQVQDAGLIFLSAMANIIANDLTAKGGTDSEIISTAIVLLGLGTCTLGVILVIMGKYRLADAVSYLPLPVVGGYLAFIGYFCFEAGVGLCIGKAIMVPTDWGYLGNTRMLILAIPGMLAGLLITWVSRNVSHDAALPTVMVSIPIAFYLYMLVTGYSMEQARDDGWIGEKSPPIRPQDVFSMIHIEHVHWSLIKELVGTWAGMVFVVSFSSCLDVAAISMDMGEALDTNQELTTVGISNCVSGLLCGFTGSYIFSQTLFTYRTGARTRWIGIFLAVAETGVFLMTVNVLEVTPLFFLGATLIFIGIDLMYEWLVEVRHKLLFAEYLILLATFVAIQIWGIDAGIFIGIVFAGVDYIVSTSQSSSLKRVSKRSRAVWDYDDWRLLQDKAYDYKHPKIVTFEIKGSVFFGSSLGLLNELLDSTGVKTLSEQPHEEIDELRGSIASPRHVPKFKKKEEAPAPQSPSASQMKAPPAFIVLDMCETSNLDASAARGCFLQFAKMCAKKDIVVCAAGAKKRIDWTLRSHDVAYNKDDEAVVKDKLTGYMTEDREIEAKILLCPTVNGALELCEHAFIHQIEAEEDTKSSGASPLISQQRPGSSEGTSDRQSMSTIFKQYIKLKEMEVEQLDKMLETKSNPQQAFYEERSYEFGDTIFKEQEYSDGFFVILRGSVAVYLDQDEADTSKSTRNIFTGAGPIAHTVRATTREVKGKALKNLYLGSVFGYVDFVLEQNRTFGAVSTSDDLLLAKFHRQGLDDLRNVSPEIERLIEKVLFQVSVRELNNVHEP